MSAFTKKTLLVFGDLSVLWVSLGAALAIRRGELRPEVLALHIPTFSVIFLLWLIVFHIVNLYELGALRNNLEFFIILAKALLANALVSMGFFYFVPGLNVAPKTVLFLMLGLALVLLFTWRHFFNRLIGARFLQKRTLILGWDAATLELAATLDAKPQLGYRLVGLARLPQHVNPPLPAAFEPKALEFSPALVPEFLHREAIESVVISPESYALAELPSLIQWCLARGVECLDVSTLFERTFKRVPLMLLTHLWFLEHIGEGRRRAYEFGKRLVDFVVGALMGLVFLAPGLLVALAIKWDSAGPVWYRQKRVGKGAKVFWLLKFRSMVKDAERFGGFKGSPDPRLTRVGKVIRRTHLDELPQIFNILKGEMSFVGPRPERPEYVSELKQKIPFYEMRLLVAPGITGWHQVNMAYDASVQDAPEKLQYDLYYIKHRSLLFDIGIMIKTVRILLRGGGR